MSADRQQPGGAPAARARVVILLGFVVSMACLFYLFATAGNAADAHSADPMSAGHISTAITPLSESVIIVFSLLNVPAAVVLLTLELLLPSTVAPIVRAGIIYGVSAAAVLWWWWLLGRVIRTRRKHHCAR